MQLVHNTPQPVKRDRLIRLPGVEALTGVKKSTIYALIRAKKFPPGITISPRYVAWSEAAVLSWVQDRITEGQMALDAQQ